MTTNISLRSRDKSDLAISVNDSGGEITFEHLSQAIQLCHPGLEAKVVYQTNQTTLVLPPQWHVVL